MITCQKQKICDSKVGDCFRACVATILNLPIDSLPNDHSDRWMFTWEKLLREYGVSTHYTTACWHEGYWIASVPSKNFESVDHAIVMKGQKVFFDPSTKKRHRKGQNLLGTGIVRHGTVFNIEDSSLLHKLVKKQL